MGKLRLLEGLQPRLNVPRLSSVHFRVRRLSLIGGRDWAVPAGARNFQREQLALASSQPIDQQTDNHKVK